MFPELIFNLIITMIGVVLGGYILFVGRLALQVTLGIIGLTATANLLAVLVAGLENGYDLVGAQAWGLLAIAIAVGAIGFWLGLKKPDIAALVIGFVAGADIALWFHDISANLMTNVGQGSAAVWIELFVLLVGGVLGYWLVRVSKDEALILITMVLGAGMIQIALGFSRSSSWTAIITLTLALAGVLVQYTLYLREIKSEQTTPKPHASSVAFFQDLDLDL